MPSRTAPKTPEAPPGAAAVVEQALAAAEALGTHLLVAVSGGADSIALLELLADLRDAGRITLTAAHVAHGIDAAAVHGEALVAARCTARAVPLLVTRLALGAAAGETVARRARRRALLVMAERAGAPMIVLGHHRRDQAETVLLRALRGTAPLGLGAMQPQRGRWLRPLLQLPAEVLRDECARRGIVPWEDPANTDPRHDRSWLRTAVLPLLGERDPAVEGALVQVAAHAQADAAAWQAVLATLPELALRDEPDGGRSIVAAPLGRYDSRMASALLRALAAQQGCPLGPRRAARVLGWLQGGAVAGWVPLGGRWRARLHRGRLSIGRHRVPVAAPEVELHAGDGLVGWPGWSLRWSDGAAPSEVPDRRALEQRFAPGPYRLRPARPGDRIRPHGARGHQRVVRTLQDAGVPAEERAGWPVLTTAGEDEVVWVVGICRGAAGLPEPGTRSLRVAVDRR